MPPAAPPLRFAAGPGRILVQGHCHQRSLVGMGPTLRLLRRIPGAEVVDLDAGCCGMAGSFGYEVEHYEVSRLVGEQRLLPGRARGGPETRRGRPGLLVPAPDRALHRPRRGAPGAAPPAAGRRGRGGALMMAPDRDLEERVSNGRHRRLRSACAVFLQGGDQAHDPVVPEVSAGRVRKSARTALIR